MDKCTLESQSQSRALSSHFLNVKMLPPKIGIVVEGRRIDRFISWALELPFTRKNLSLSRSYRLLMLPFVYQKRRAKWVMPLLAPIENFTSQYISYIYIVIRLFDLVLWLVLRSHFSISAEIFLFGGNHIAIARESRGRLNVEICNCKLSTIVS